MTLSTPSAGLNAQHLIDSMTTRPDGPRHPYRPSDIYDFSQEALRDILCSMGETDPDDLTSYHAEYDILFPDPKSNTIDTIIRELSNAVKTLHADEFSRHYLSDLALQYSLCPMHFCDYASCFDDDDAECALIRQYFPNHDT